MRFKSASSPWYTLPWSFAFLFSTEDPLLSSITITIAMPYLFARFTTCTPNSYASIMMWNMIKHFPRPFPTQHQHGATQSGKYSPHRQSSSWRACIVSMHSDGSYLLNRTDTAFHRYTHGYWLLAGDGGMILMHSIFVMSIVHVRWLFVALCAMPLKRHLSVTVGFANSCCPECYLRVREPCQRFK